MFMADPDAPEPYTRRNSLRLSGFDYSAKRYYFVTLVTLQRRRVFTDAKLANATLNVLVPTEANDGLPSLFLLSNAGSLSRAARFGRFGQDAR